MNYSYDMMYPFQRGIDSAYGTEVLPALAVFCALFAFIGLALMAFQVWLYFRVFAKAGYNGWMGLLSLIPGVGPFVCLLVLAFDKWPIEMSGGSGQNPSAPMAPATPPSTSASSAAQTVPSAPVEVKDSLATTPSPGEEAMHIAEQTASDAHHQQ